MSNPAENIEWVARSERKCANSFSLRVNTEHTDTVEPEEKSYLNDNKRLRCIKLVNRVKRKLNDERCKVCNYFQVEQIIY